MRGDEGRVRGDEGRVRGDEGRVRGDEGEGVRGDKKENEEIAKIKSELTTRKSSGAARHLLHLPVILGAQHRG